MAKRGIKVIDLFCGIGGLSYGFVMEDFNVVAGYDIEASCKFAYETNNKAKFFECDLTTLDSNSLVKQFGNSLRILIGCAPCQPFSSYSFKVKNKDNKKVNLLYTFSRLIQETQPTIVCMENVPQLMDFGEGAVFGDFCNSLESQGYSLTYSIVFCPSYGIPQKRKRLVLLASKLGDFGLILPTHASENFVTVRDAIGDLPMIEAGETDILDKLHRARSLSGKNLLRIQNSVPGGSWRTWPESLIPECFKRETGRTYGSVYGRMKWDEPAPTMTTQCTGYGNGRFGHPEQNRAISLREAARFQTFPDSYKFIEKDDCYSPSVICKQIGNAVPPRLGQVIAHSVKIHLNEYGLWPKRK